MWFYLRSKVWNIVCDYMFMLLPKCGSFWGGCHGGQGVKTQITISWNLCFMAHTISFTWMDTVPSGFRKSYRQHATHWPAEHLGKVWCNEHLSLWRPLGLYKHLVNSIVDSLIHSWLRSHRTAQLLLLNFDSLREDGMSFIHLSVFFVCVCVCSFYLATTRS